MGNKLITEIREFLDAEEQECGIEDAYDKDTFEGYANHLLNKAVLEILTLKQQLKTAKQK